MISLVYLASAIALGLSLTKRLGLKFFPLEVPSLAIALGLLLWTWLSFLFALVLPYSLSLPATIAVASITSFLLARRSPSWQWRPLPGGRPAQIAWCLFTVATTLLIGWLTWTHDLISTPDGLYSANASWADLSLHASLASHFAAGTHLSLNLPIATTAHLTYPFMADLLSAWFIQGGWSLHLAFFVPSILLVMAFIQLMLSFGVRLMGKIGGMIGGLSLTLLCGSAIGVFAAASDFGASGQTLTYFLSHLPHDYTALTTPNLQLTNLLADAILPQRAFLMGFSTFATIMIFFTEIRLHPSQRLSLLTGGLIGLLPLVHAHTFLVLMAILTAFWIETVIKTRTVLNSWLFIIATTLTVAAPQILWQASANHTGTGGHLALGWAVQPGESLLTFAVDNYGLTLLLIIAATILLIVRRPLRKYLTWYAPFVGVFIFANLYSPQPFAYDNHKLILYVYLFTYILASYAGLWLISRYHRAIIPVAVLVVLVTASGGLAVLRELETQDQFASNDDIALASWVKTHTSPEDAFLTTDRPNQPISALAGRPIVCGYRGWLYNYHLEYQPRLNTIQLALLGKLRPDNPYHAQYLAVSSMEDPAWTVDTHAMATRYQLMYSSHSWTVYRLQ